MLRIRFYALTGLENDIMNAGGLMRELSTEDMYDLQYLDRRGRWVTKPELIRYLYGDDWAEEITEEQAKALLAKWNDPTDILYKQIPKEMLAAAEAANLIEPEADGIEVPPYGERYAALAVVGDGPGAIEARERQPFSGMSGRFLKDVLSELGMDLDKVYWANVYERYGEAPNPDKTSAYGKALLRRLKELPNLKGVLAVSAIAGEALTGTEITNVSEARTHTYSTPEGIPIIVTYHPSALLRSGQRKSKFFRNFQADIKRAVELVKQRELAEPEEEETRGDVALPDPGRAQRHPDR